MPNEIQHRVSAALAALAQPDRIHDLAVDAAGQVSFTFHLKREDPATLVRDARRAVTGPALEGERRREREGEEVGGVEAGEAGGPEGAPRVARHGRGVGAREHEPGEDVEEPDPDVPADADPLHERRRARDERVAEVEEQDPERGREAETGQGWEPVGPGRVHPENDALRRWRRPRPAPGNTPGEPAVRPCAAELRAAPDGAFPLSAAPAAERGEGPRLQRGGGARGGRRDGADGRALLGGAHLRLALEHDALVDRERRALHVAAELRRMVQLDGGLRLDVPVHLAVHDDRSAGDVRVDPRVLADDEDVVREDRALELRVDPDGSGEGQLALVALLVERAGVRDVGEGRGASLLEVAPAEGTEEPQAVAEDASAERRFIGPRGWER